MLQARRGGIQDWMLEGHDPTSQTEGDDAVVAQLPDPLVGLPRSAGLLHSPPSRDIGIRYPQRNDLVRGEPRLPLGSEDPTHNRHGATRVDPCPPERRAAIEDALRHFGAL